MIKDEQQMISFNQESPEDIAERVNEFLDKGWLVIRDNIVIGKVPAGFVRGSGYIILERVVAAADAGPEETDA